MVSPSLAVVFERDFLHVISAAQKEMKVFLTVNTFLSPPSSALLCLKTHFTAFLREGYFCHILDRFRPVLCIYDKDRMELW